MSDTRRIYNRPTGGIFKHAYQQICMCRCSWCRDPAKETWILRKRRKMQFRHDRLLSTKHARFE